MNREFFEHICSFAGLEKNENNIFIDHVSSTAFFLESDGVHILGKMNDELLNLINNEVSININGDVNKFDDNISQNWRIIELRLTVPTIIGSVNLLSIIEIIQKYYSNLKRDEITNYYQKIYRKNK